MNINKAIHLSKLKRQYKAFFILASRTLKQSGKLLALLEANIECYDKGHKRLCIALYTQTVRLLQGIIILSNKGLDEEAAILTRSLIENTAYLLFITERNHDERAELYVHSRALSAAVAVSEFNSMAPNGERKVDENQYIKRELEAVQFFKNKYGQNKSIKEIKENYTLKPRNAAEQLQGEIKQIFITNYKILYRPASSVAHGEAPLRFIKYQNNKLSLKKWASGKLVKICLQVAIILTLYSIESLTKLLSVEENFHVDKISEELFSLFTVE